MGDWISTGVALVSAKFLTILASMSMAGIAVGLDAQRHTLPSAILAIFAGTVVGVIAASSICTLMGWPEQVGYGISAIAAVSANNLVRWILRVSVDPTSLIRLWLNRGGKE